jgi:DNA polymerase III epsilon subunit-like protein
MSLFSEHLLVIDTETTGFVDNPASRVVELAAICLNRDGDKIDSFESFICPDLLSWEGVASAGKTTGITWEQVVGAPKHLEVAQEFTAWMEGLAVRSATAFNVAFDASMMERIPIRDLLWGPCIMLRAMELMGPAGALRPGQSWHRSYRPELPWLYPKLSDAAAFFGCTAQGDAHRALCDAHLAADVAVAIQRQEQA